MTTPIYESRELLDQYLLFHYGSEKEILPYPGGPRDALGYPVRCALECQSQKIHHPGNENLRALDLGCAVGRSTFEIARAYHEVIGVDFSHQFINTAKILKAQGDFAYSRIEEGSRKTQLNASVPHEIDRSRVQFEQGDACNLRKDLGSFHLILMANLIDRLPNPKACLERLPNLLFPKGILVITSPYTWMEVYTPKDQWTGGTDDKTTLEGLRAVLEPNFNLLKTKDMPFLIREHARKFQWSVAQASIWQNN
ncbi:MAG: putative 4-mercaptohistidine N1-methyltransferase [Verrucomicrobiota bacterium]